MTAAVGGASPVTVGAWLAVREPAPPAALAARLRELVVAWDARALDAHAREAPVLLLRAGEAVLARLLREAATTRTSALDLLVADALVTYAFEAAGEEPATLEDAATSAIAHIAGVPAESGAAGA